MSRAISKLFPEIDQGDIALTVEFDVEKNDWAIDLKKGTHYLRTYMEPAEAEMCMAGTPCPSLQLQIDQLQTDFCSF